MPLIQRCPYLISRVSVKRVPLYCVHFVYIWGPGEVSCIELHVYILRKHIRDTVKFP